MSCQYSCYGHKCGNEFVNDNDLCAEHAKDKCWCGKQAYFGCCMELQFVCGAPLCKEHADYCPRHGGTKPPPPKPVCDKCGQEISE